MTRENGTDGGAVIVNTAEAARMVYGVPDGARPSRGQTNQIAALCRAGKLDAVRVGRRWLIRLEWSSSREG